MAEAFYSVLKANKLDTIADCQDKLPIIVQSFEIPALEKFATLSDLPLIYLFHNSDLFDWDEVGEKFNGVGPPKADVIDSDSPTSQSMMIKQMHERDLAVHPWTFQDDNLTKKSTAYEELKLYVDSGIDGIFTEFPHSSYALLENLGSKADFPS